MVRRVNPYVAAILLGLTIGALTAFAGCFDMRANAAEPSEAELAKLEPLEIPGGEILALYISQRPFGWTCDDPAPLTYGELDDLLNRLGKAEVRQLELEERIAQLEAQLTTESTKE